MIARLLISASIEARIGEIGKQLEKASLTNPHPDLLYFPFDSKLGILEARKIKEHFSLKPYSAKGRAAVLEDGGDLTIDAQNALLKILEELPEEAIFILGSDSESKFLPTILSRCQIIRLEGVGDKTEKNYTEDIERLLRVSTEERFEFVEKLKKKEEFLRSLVQYFHSKLPLYKDFSKELLQTEEWVNHNVNIRAILEYLMLKMPMI